MNDRKLSSWISCSYLFILLAPSIRARPGTGSDFILLKSLFLLQNHGNSMSLEVIEAFSYEGIPNSLRIEKET